MDTEEPHNEILSNFHGRQASSAFLCRYQKCPRAAQGFRTSELREKHEESHRSRFQCSHAPCGFFGTTFNTRAALKKHAAQYHDEEDAASIPNSLARKPRRAPEDRSLFTFTAESRKRRRSHDLSPQDNMKMGTRFDASNTSTNIVPDLSERSWDRDLNRRITIPLKRKISDPHVEDMYEQELSSLTPPRQPSKPRPANPESAISGLMGARGKPVHSSLELERKPWAWYNSGGQNPYLGDRLPSPWGSPSPDLKSSATSAAASRLQRNDILDYPENILQYNPEANFASESSPYGTISPKEASLDHDAPGPTLPPLEELYRDPSSPHSTSVYRGTTIGPLPPLEESYRVEPDSFLIPSLPNFSPSTHLESPSDWK